MEKLIPFLIVLKDAAVFVGRWIQVHSAFVTAAATLVIAAFTWALWWATRRLWKVSQEQSRHMETSIAVAKEAADAAEKSANAATQTVKTMEDTADRQLRAYLSVRADYIFTFSPTIPVEIRIITMNHGQTPAYNVSHSALVDILPYPLPIDYQLPNIPDPQETSYVLHPSATFYGFVYATRLFSEDEISKVVTNNGYRIYIFGLLKYKDAFGKERQTKFCTSVAGDKNLAIIAQGIPIESEVKVKFQPWQQHNEAD